MRGFFLIVALVLAACSAGCAPVPPAEPVAVECSATDGDTIRCGDERIRLLGIDAPELAGHCRPGRDCVEGDAAASQAALAAGLRLGPVSVRRTGRDRYGRTLGAVLVAVPSSTGGVGPITMTDLACRQLELGAAEYVRRWDDRRLVARACPALAR